MEGLKQKGMERREDERTAVEEGIRKGAMERGGGEGGEDWSRRGPKGQRKEAVRGRERHGDLQGVFGEDGRKIHFLIKPDAILPPSAADFIRPPLPFL